MGFSFHAQSHFILTVWQVRQTAAWITAAPPGPAALPLVSKPEEDQLAVYISLSISPFSSWKSLVFNTVQVKPQKA